MRIRPQPYCGGAARRQRMSRDVILNGDGDTRRVRRCRPHAPTGNEKLIDLRCTRETIPNTAVFIIVRFCHPLGTSSRADAVRPIADRAISVFKNAKKKKKHRVRLYTTNPIRSSPTRCRSESTEIELCAHTYTCGRTRKSVEIFGGAKSPKNVRIYFRESNEC